MKQQKAPLHGKKEPNPTKRRNNRNLDKSMQQIKKLRTQIDNLDSNVISLISKRIVLAQKIQFIKKQHHISKVDQKRETTIIKRLQKQHPTLKKLITSIYPHIFSHTRGKK